MNVFNVCQSEDWLNCRMVVLQSAMKQLFLVDARRNEAHVSKARAVVIQIRLK